MSRRASWPPPVQKKRGKDVLRVTLPGGGRRSITLGPTGSPEAQAEYRRILAEMEAHGRQLPPEPAADITCVEIAAAHAAWAEGYHDWRQAHRVKRACARVIELYGHTPAAAFGPLALRAVRETWVREGLSRQYVNALTNCVRAAWRWAAGEQLVTYAVADALQGGKRAAVPGLRRKKTEAPEAPKVRPAPDEDVDATLPELPPAVADMIVLQRLTGARPGEVCALRPCDLVRPWKVVDGVDVWLYRLDEHKTDWRGQHRWIPIGPQAQALLAPYLAGRPPDAYCFSPREVAERWLRENGREVCFRRKRAPGLRYNTQAYDHCVRKGLLRVNRKRAEADPPVPPVPRWAPNMVRHAVGTFIETELGREDARCVLGHKHPSTTAIYAEQVERAAKVIARMG